jgi:hypothetical protein
MNLYNHTRKLFQNGEVDLAALKVMLVGSGYTFAATETAITNAAAVEVSGNGWPAGGEAIANAAVTTVNTNESQLLGDDISVTASGGDIGPAEGFVIYDDTSVNDNPLFYESFAAAETAGDGTPFNITWDATLGIYTVEAPA